MSRPPSTWIRISCCNSRQPTETSSDSENAEVTLAFLSGSRFHRQMLVSPNFRRPVIVLLLFFGILRSISAAPVTPSPQTSQTPPPPNQPAETPSKAVEISVVKIFSTARYPDLYKPWMRQAPSESSGSGVVI